MPRTSLQRSAPRIAFAAIVAVGLTSAGFVAVADDEFDPCIGNQQRCTYDVELGSVCSGVTRTDPNCPLEILGDGMKFKVETASTGLKGSSPAPVVCRYLKTKRPAGGGVCASYGDPVEFSYSGKVASGDACPSGNGTCVPEM